MSPDQVSRRSLVRGSVVVVVGGVVGFVVAPNSNAAEAKSASTAANAYGATAPKADRPIAKLADIPAGGGLIVKSADVVLVRDDAGGVKAFSSTCTHQGCTVDKVADGTIDCPCH